MRVHLFSHIECKIKLAIVQVFSATTNNSNETAPTLKKNDIVLFSHPFISARKDKKLTPPIEVLIQQMAEH